MQSPGFRKRYMFLLALLPLLLSGCWDRIETNDLAFVLTSSVDLENDGKVRVAYLMALPGQMGGASGGGGGTSGKQSYYVDSEVGSNVREATYRLQKRIPRRINLAHRRTVVIGEAYAKNGIYPLFDSLIRMPDSRLNTFLVVTKGKGYHLLNTQPKFERFPAEAIRELAKPPFIMNLTMKDVGLMLTMGSDPVVAYMEGAKSQKGKKPSEEIQVMGLAQFQSDKMVGIFEDESALALSWLNNKFTVSMVTFPMEDNKDISIQIVEGHCRVTPNLNGGQISFDIDLKLIGKLREDLSGQDFNESKAMHKVESKFAHFAKQTLQKTIKQMQDNKTDSAQFGMRLKEKYPAQWRQGLKDNWRELFSKAAVTIHSKTAITETGLINQNVLKHGGAGAP